MPSRLRPTASVAANAILVGDPGRALLLAQELLEKPKMSNHARGLWGYSGRTATGEELTIQSTGMGGPSAAIVLADLAELKVRRAVRIGTCVAVDQSCNLGEMLIVSEARSRDVTALPDPSLTMELQRKLDGEARTAAIVSIDGAHDAPASPPGASASDLQTATVLSRGRALGVAVAAVLIIEESASGKRISDDALEEAAKISGAAARDILST